MGTGSKKGSKGNGGKRWLLFFYTIPAKPVANRMSIWRKLMKSGAVLLKGSAYLFPYSNEHVELAQWLVIEVKEMQGDAAFVTSDSVETMDEDALTELFNQCRRSDYLPLEQGLDEIAGKWDSIKKGGQSVSAKTLTAPLARLRKSLTEVKKIDFFATREGHALEQRLDALAEEIREYSEPSGKQTRPVELPRKSVADFSGRRWVTRCKPFVDRMASAWLISRFIDPQATFSFLAESEATMPDDAVAFDMYQGELTHWGDLCTFEVLVKVFSISDRAVEAIAEIVHALDVKDDKFHPAEARGVEDVLRGIRKTALNDHDALIRGMQVFEMLYMARKP